MATGTNFTLMKQLILVFAVFLLVFSGFISCKKCYMCTTNSTNNAEYCAGTYSQAELTQLDTQCVRAGGIWSRANM